MSKNDKIILIGTRGKNCFPEKMIEKIYKDIDVDFSYNNARNIGINLLLKFNNHQIRSIKIAYMKFINNLHFKPEILTLLPLESQKKAKSIEPEIEFEPNLKVVLEEALPLYVCTVIYGTVIESKLSEYSMRYLATENAINNAEEIKNKLLIQYNKIRQNKITQELSEVTVNLNLDQN
jgi:F-type H+-transporting ATPase subunit gamma